MLWVELENAGVDISHRLIWIEEKVERDVYTSIVGVGRTAKVLTSYRTKPTDAAPPSRTVDQIIVEPTFGGLLSGTVA